MVSKLITRPDVIKMGETSTFLKYLAEKFTELKEESNSMFTVSGLL